MKLKNLNLTLGTTIFTLLFAGAVHNNSHANVEVNVFEVNGEDEEVTIPANEEVNIYAEVENTGSETDSIALEVNGQVHKGSWYYIDAGENKTIEDSRDHSTWGPGEFTASMGDQEVLVTVLGGDIQVAVFEVNGESEEVTVREDEEVNIYAEVENFGNQDDSIALAIDEQVHQNSWYHVEAGEEKTIEDSRDHSTWGPGEYTASMGDHEVLVIVESANYLAENMESADFSLTNYPNPAENNTTISFKLEESNAVELHIFDLQGKHVKTVAEETFAVGEHSVEVDLTGLASGNYFYSLQTGSMFETNQLIVE